MYECVRCESNEPRVYGDIFLLLNTLVSDCQQMHFSHYENKRVITFSDCFASSFHYCDLPRKIASLGFLQDLRSCG